MIPKKFSRKELLVIPKSKEDFIKNEPDTDYTWYYVLEDYEIKNMCNYLGIENE